MSRRSPVAALSLLVFIATLAPSANARRSWPDWAAAASQVTAPPSSTGATVLLDELRIEVEPDGRLRERGRRVVRIESALGRDAATPWVHYAPDTDSVTMLRGWHRQGDGRVKTLGKDAVVEAAAEPDVLHGALRVRMLETEPIAEPGTTIAVEWTLRGRLLFAQEETTWGGPHPVARERVEIELPTDWQLVSQHLGLTPTQHREGRLTTFELTDLPALPHDPWQRIEPAGRSFFDFVSAPSGATRPLPTRGFDDWSAVATWASEQVSPALVTPVPGLPELPGGPPLLLEQRLGLVVDAVRRLRYVSVESGLGSGGGYRPRPATEVQRSGYGDCKDQSLFACSVAGSLGLRAHPVLVHTERPLHEAWPSPRQFNHCIVGFEVPDGHDAPAVVEHERLGSLLLFDPTDRASDLGALPATLHGAVGLACTADGGGLITFPAQRPRDHARELTLEGTLKTDGGITASLVLLSRGRPAGQLRWSARHRSAADHERELRSTITSLLPGAAIESLRSELEGSSGHRLEAEVLLRRGAQRLGEDGLVLTPGRLAPLPLPALDCAAHDAAHRVAAHRVHQRWRLTVPSGLRQLHAATSPSVDSTVVRHEQDARLADGVLHWERTLELGPETVPAADCADFSRALDDVHAAGRTALRLGPAGS
ncbi:MAG: DUF3857 domain-containing protein [Acidobacteriota bacterium]